MAVTINGTTGIAGVDGSASTPSYQGADTNTGIFFPAADTIAFGEGGAEAMRIDSSGNVGIGTSSPSSKLDVRGVSSFGDQTNGVVYITTPSSTEGRIGTGGRTSVTAMNLTFYTSDSGANYERARITSGGYFKASDNGTYYQGASASIHEFNQSADVVTLSIYSGNTSLSTGGIALIYANRNTTNGTFYAISYYNLAATAYKFRVADSGTVTNTTGTYTTISDIKLKQDITDASSQWDDIKSLRIVNYRLKDYVQADPNSKPFLGLIAQEVEQVCPGLVEEQEDEVPGEDGKLVKNGEVTKGVKTSILYMKAVKALQEAMARIETLEAQNAAFEARLAALENT
jgi:hypothetical protein